MLLNIESVKTNPSGKSCIVKAGGKDYFAKPDMGLAAGMNIDAVTQVSEFNGKQNTWIKKYTVATNNAAPVGDRAPEASAGRAEGLKPNAPTGAAPFWMPFASNVVAHAIQAGIITAPSMIGAWVDAAKSAAESAAK